MLENPIVELNNLLVEKDQLEKEILDITKAIDGSEGGVDTDLAIKCNKLNSRLFEIETQLSVMGYNINQN